MHAQTGQVVLVGAAQDAHLMAVQQRVCDLGHTPFVLSPLDFPANLRISLGEQLDQIRVDGVDFGWPSAIYLRNLHQSPASGGAQEENATQEDLHRKLLMHRERNTILEALICRWEVMGIPIYNSPSANRNVTKPLQMALLARAGLPVPNTRWTNDPGEVLDLAAGGELIYKPVAGGAATRKLEKQDLQSERLDRLSAAPVTFQELLPGEDIRVYVIDERVIASYHIVTNHIDYRQNEQRVESIELDAQTQVQCIAACKALGLRFSGIDLKRDKHGMLRILELNPSPMFLGFDRLAGTDVCGALARTLVDHCTVD